MKHNLKTMTILLTLGFLFSCKMEKEKRSCMVKAEPNACCSAEMKICQCASSLNYSELLVSSSWKTTVVRDEHGADVTSDFPQFIGKAVYQKTGDFQLLTLKDEPRAMGIWAVSADGRKRLMIFENQDGSKTTRVTEIVLLNKTHFTYRATLDNGKILTVEHDAIQ